MGAFAHGQELQQADRFEEALARVSSARSLSTPASRRAYSGMAGVYTNYFRQPEKAAASYEAAMKHLDRMSEREKYRTLGTYYLDIVRNYEKAIENFETLVNRYPADDSGHGNLALAYMHVGESRMRWPKSARVSRSIRRIRCSATTTRCIRCTPGISPRRSPRPRRVQEENPKLEYAYLPEALSQLAKGDAAAAAESYRRLSAMSPLGASFAIMGQADMAMYFGRHREAVQLLQQGIEADLKNKNATQAAQKTWRWPRRTRPSGSRRRAADAAAQAAKLSRQESTLFPAALVLARVGRDELALKIAADLDRRLQRRTTAYAGIIRGAVALHHDRVSEGIEALRGAKQRYDSWPGRLLLGKAYVEADHFAEGLTRAGRGPQAARRSDRRVPLRPADDAVSAAVVLLARSRAAGAGRVG